MAERRYDPEGTKRAILAAARRVFVAKGVGQASMSDIAREAEVTKSLIHHHFGSKEELWAEVKRSSFEQYFGAMLDIIRAEGDDADPMRDAIEFTFRFHQQHPDMNRLMSWLHIDGDAAESPLHDQVCREGLARIRRAQLEGEFRSDVEPAWIQASFLLLAEAWFQRKFMFASWDLGPDDPGGDLDERFLRDAMKIFFEGVLPRAPTDSGEADPPAG